MPKDLKLKEKRFEENEQRNTHRHQTHTHTRGTESRTGMKSWSHLICCQHISVYGPQSLSVLPTANITERIKKMSSLSLFIKIKWVCVCVREREGEEEMAWGRRMFYTRFLRNVSETLCLSVEWKYDLCFPFILFHYLVAGGDWDGVCVCVFVQEYLLLNLLSCNNS